MGLSPSTLFHFTSKDGLKGILKDNFKIKYCRERIEHNQWHLELAIPMVSFCDIKISEITDHIVKYGYYGIGLSKKWAINKGLHPVIYMNRKSPFSHNLITTIHKFISMRNINKYDKESLIDLLRYMKIYEGKFKRRNKIIENYRFSDEREWRYVPEMILNSKFSSWLTIDKYNTPTKKRKENKKLVNERLYFDANEILYVIVKKESEINEIINHIRNVKGMNYTMEEVERLMTRILSYERIINDF